MQGQKNFAATRRTLSARGSVVLLILLLLCFAATGYTFELSEYKRLARDTIAKVQNGNISNIDQLIEQQSRLVQIGVQACEDYARNHPKARPILNLVVSNSEMMKRLSLGEIEEKWHQGGELEKHGYAAREDHFGDVGNLIDAVIHPATAYIALTNYKLDGNSAHLQQVIAELSEVLVHIEHLD